MTWDWLVQRTGKYCSIRRMEYLEFQTEIFGRMESALGRFPFNKNYRFKFSEISLVEWNASDRFPGFVVTCPATQGMLGDHLLCLKILAKAKTWFNNMAKRQEQNYWRAKVEGSVIRSKLQKKHNYSCNIPLLVEGSKLLHWCCRNRLMSFATKPHAEHWYAATAAIFANAHVSSRSVERLKPRFLANGTQNFR